jgi:type IV pilus assembly protein PilW
MLRPTRHRRQRGLSLVELMVGIAVGLFVVAAAAMLVSTQLNDNRRLLLETQMQQDLRAAAEVMTRELRRAGHWALAERGVWSEDNGGSEANPYDAVMPTEGTANDVSFEYMRRPGEEGPFGFRLATVGSGTSARGVIQTLLAGGGWQELTDSNVLDIAAFTITRVNGPAARIACPNECPGGGTACWPTLTVREFVVDIEARAARDPAIRRSLSTVVRLRNDELQFNTAGAAQACPS